MDYFILLFYFVFADSAREALAELDVADTLITQLKRAPDAERRHVILEILGSLGESGKTPFSCYSKNPSCFRIYKPISKIKKIFPIFSAAQPDALKLQFAESGVPEALSEMIRDLQGHSDPHDLCSVKIASNLIVSLLLGGERFGATDGLLVNRLFALKNS